MKKDAAEFRLVQTHIFDARRGYSRWVTPGIVTYITERGPSAKADLWTNRQGNLFARFVSNGYSLHFRVESISSNQLTPEMKDRVEDFLCEMLTTWLVDGVDNNLECDAVEYD